MPKRLALFCSIAACALSVPAMAQAGTGAYIPPSYVPPSGAIALPPQPGTAPAATANPEFERARTAWIDECVRNYDPDRRDANGGAVGGVLGAVVGGVAGNRIAGHGSRLAGTLIGGGLGGLAGAVIGDAIDRKNSEKAEAEAVAWCEDYLARNTAPAPGYGYPSPLPYGYPMAGYAMAYPYGPPVMLQPVMIPVQRCHEQEVVEKIVYRNVPVRRVVYDKRVKIVPTKAVKTVKTVK